MTFTLLNTVATRNTVYMYLATFFSLSL